MEYQIIQINSNTWRIEDGGVRFFLLTGTEKALLIDSGMMVNNAKEIAESLTDLPVSLLNTHADIPINTDTIRILHDGAQDILAGKVLGNPEEMFGNSIVAYDLGFCTILCDS